MAEPMNDRELVNMACFRLRDAAQRLVLLAASASDRALVEQLQAAAQSLREEERQLGRHCLEGAGAESKKRRSSPASLS